MPDHSERTLRIAYLYSDLPAYVRAKKTLQTLVELGHEVHFIGCRRRSSWDASRPEGVEYHIEERVLDSGFASAPKLIGFARFASRVVQEIQADVLVVVNEELALPFVMGWLPRPKRVVVDLYDSIAMRTRGHVRLLAPFWNAVSRAVLGRIDALVEVDDSRLAWHKVLPPVTAVTYNAPRWQEAGALPEGLPDRYLYAGGTLEDSLHGIEPLTAALDLVPEAQVVVTGKPKGRFTTERFLAHPRVHFLGVLPYEQVLAIIAGSRGVFAHYTPERLNYIYGAPNKMFEAMMGGVPTLINAENRASALVEKLGCGLVAPYGNVPQLTENLRWLFEGDTALQKASVEAQKVFRREYAWESRAAEAWSELLNRITAGD